MTRKVGPSGKNGPAAPSKASLVLDTRTLEKLDKLPTSNDPGDMLSQLEEYNDRAKAKEEAEQAREEELALAKELVEEEVVNELPH